MPCAAVVARLLGFLSLQCLGTHVAAVRGPHQGHWLSVPSLFSAWALCPPQSRCLIGDSGARGLERVLLILSAPE